MIYFYQQEENQTKGRVIGGVATVLYFVVLILLFLLVQFRQEVPDPAEGGLMINFGNVDEAAPGADMALNDEIADARQQEQQTPKVESEEEQMTQDFEEAPVIKQEAKRKVEKPKTENKTPQPKPNPQPPAEKPREVNRRALFPGRTAGSTAASDGTGKGTGNQGNLAGTANGSFDGSGTGTGGTGPGNGAPGTGGQASLSGRTLAGALPRPDYGARDEGRVVVEITVDRNGRVTSASYRSSGSTTNNSTLVAAALRAARNARFNVDDNAPLSQRGTITYNFRMQ